MKTTKKTMLFQLAVIFLMSSTYAIGEWEILTKLNFSSQIRRHPHSLLFVTVPWCGESRALMKDLTRLITGRQQEFSNLKLMVVYRNTDKMLAQAVGATEGITIQYYHHGISYKYQGKLRSQSILSSIYPYLSYPPEELSLTHLKSPEDLKAFIESTDKALLLLDFCGWSSVMLSKLKNNMTGFHMEMGGDIFKASFQSETDQVIPRGRDKQKGMADGNLMCEIQRGFGGFPWPAKFSVINHTAALQDPALTCTAEDAKKFDSFFLKFIYAAREFFLPSERHRFGLVTERSLVSSLGVGESDSWMAILQSVGCPSCSKILKEGDDIKKVLKMDNPIVAEVESNGQEFGPSLPANRPSMVLFVDRSSGSLENKSKSQEALNVFREIAARYQVSDWNEWQNDIQPEKSMNQAYGHNRLKKFRSFDDIGTKDRVSVMILDEDKHTTLDNVASGLKGSSLHEVLTNLVHRMRETKLSSIAKDVGFRLLSNDLDIKVLDVLPSEKDVPSSQVSSPPSEGGKEEKSSHLDEDNSPNVLTLTSTEYDGGKSLDEGNNPNMLTVTTTENDGGKSLEVGPSSHYENEEKIFQDTVKQSLSIEAEQVGTVAKSVDEEIKTSSQIELEDDVPYTFKGSFLFSDGDYQLLNALTGGSVIPSAVIVDPALQQHFVLSDELASGYSQLEDFLQRYLNGSLQPYKRSESTVRIPKEATPPPFVNLDFHEADSLPRVTTSTFSLMVHDVNQSAEGIGPITRNEDVLVLFSNNWCGFCQRMELVTREVYRAFKGYTKTLKRSSSDRKPVGKGSLANDASVKTPAIYLMDCTFNDCSFILKSINQRDVYPALMLFPAERNEVVPYEGDTSVNEVLKFLAHHGNYSHHIMREMGIFSAPFRKADRNQTMPVQSSTAVHVESPGSDKLYEILLGTKTMPEGAVENNRGESQCPNIPTSQVKVGSFLIATDKLLAAHPFENSVVLIVKADPERGFQGLIINKHITWDSFQDLEETLEFLKEAPLSFGGPVIEPSMPLVALTKGVDQNQHSQVLPGVHFIDQSAVLHEIETLKPGDQTLGNYWFFLGYSSWGYDQLFNEIDEGAWDINNNDAGLAWP